jgi:hypothetical protein
MEIALPRGIAARAERHTAPPIARGVYGRRLMEGAQGTLEHRANGDGVRGGRLQETLTGKSRDNGP